VALAAVVSVDGRLLVHGVAGPDVRRILVGGLEQDLSPKRAYLAVFPDEGRDLSDYAVTAELHGGSRVTYPFTRAPYRTG
jgi:hypothetical protein